MCIIRTSATNHEIHTMLSSVQGSSRHWGRMIDCNGVKHDCKCTQLIVVENSMIVMLRNTTIHL